MITFLISLYIFLSVNDLILYAVNALQAKNMLLGLALISIFACAGAWYKRQLNPLYFLVQLVLISIAVGLNARQDLPSVLQQSFSVIVVILIPVMIDRYSGEAGEKWAFISNVILLSLVTMMVFKIAFVLYQMGVVGNPVLDFLLQNIQGRGEIDGVSRLNTGTQLVMLYGLTLCVVRLLTSKGTRKILYVFLCMLFVVDLFIASSRFFTLIAPIVIVITLAVGNVKIPKSVLVGVGICTLVVGAFLVQDIYSNRVSVGDDGDSIRSEEKAAIIDAFLDAPVLGHGSGYAIPDTVRSEDVPFMYEVQVLAFLMQFGIVGAVLFVTALFKLIRPHVKTGLGSLAIFYVGVFFSASYYNPYMLGTYAGLSVAMIIIILRELSAKKMGAQV